MRALSPDFPARGRSASSRSHTVSTATIQSGARAKMLETSVSSSYNIPLLIGIIGLYLMQLITIQQIEKLLHFTWLQKSYFLLHLIWCCINQTCLGFFVSSTVVREDSSASTCLCRRALRGTVGVLREEAFTGVGGRLARLFVPTSGISDRTFCEFQISLGTFRDQYICEKSTV